MKGKDEKLIKIFVIGSFILFIVTCVIALYANKLGISQEEVENRQKLADDGHLGGYELLVEEELPKEVSKKEFVKMKEKGEEFYVYFYSPYCPYCIDSWEMVTEKMEENGENFVIVNVNRDKKFQNMEGIRGVPILAKYKEGKQVDILNGVQTEEDVINFLKEGTGGLDEQDNEDSKK